MDKMDFILNVICSCINKEQLDNAVTWGFSILGKQNLSVESKKLSTELLLFNYNRINSKLFI